MLRSLERRKCCPKEWRKDPIGAVPSYRNLTRSVRGPRATPFFDIRPRLAWCGSSDPPPRRRRRGYCVRIFRFAGGTIHAAPAFGFRSTARRAPAICGTVDTRRRRPDRCNRPMELLYQIGRRFERHPAGQHWCCAGNDRAGVMVVGCPPVRMEAH